MLHSILLRAFSHLKSLLPQRPRTPGDWLTMLSALAILVYIIYKSWSLGITTDEAITYEDFAKRGNFLFLTDGGNHILNSFLIFFTSIAFPYSEFAIRLPNVLAGMLYLLLAYKISHGKGWGYVYFAILAGSWFLAEYFCMARGYGIASSLVLLAAYALMKLDEDESSDKYIIIGLYAMILASFANFSAVSVLIAIALELAVTRLPRHIIGILKKYYLDLLVLAVLGLAVLVGLFKVTEGERLFAAYGLGFTEAIWDGLFRFYSADLGLNKILLIISLSLYVSIIALLHIRNSGKLRMSRIAIAYLLVWLGFHYLLHKPLPYERTLLPAFPIFALSAIEILAILRRYLPTARYGKPAFAASHGLGLTIFIVIGISYYRQADTNAFYDWLPDLAYKSQQYELFHISPEQIDRSQRFFSTENPAKIFYQNKKGKRLYRELKSGEPAQVIDQDSIRLSWYPEKNALLVEISREANYSFWEEQPYLALRMDDGMLHESSPAPELINIMRFHKPISVSGYLAWIFHPDREDVNSYSLARPCKGEWLESGAIMTSR